MSHPLFRLSGIAKTYESRCVLNVERLEVETGEILALVGPSGAGKSTLLRILGLLEAPTTGIIEFDGQRVNQGNPTLEMRRQITMVFQRPLLLSASVWENVIYGLQVRGLSPDGQVEALLDRLGLTPLRRARAHTLSGGEVQRVALARALAIRPRALLLDEPTANLDPRNIQLIETMVREENEVRQTTVVLVTHHIFQARRLAQRVALLLEGQVVEIAPSETFFTCPQDPRTRAFVQGDMIY